MTCNLSRKVAAILLSVAMVFTMMPWLGGVAYAAGEQGPLITVNTATELKAALESTADADNGATIQVNADGIKQEGKHLFVAPLFNCKCGTRFVIHTCNGRYLHDLFSVKIYRVEECPCGKNRFA